MSTGLPEANGGSVEEALVRINLGARRMIDGDQPQLIDEVDFFHRLAEAHAEIAIARFQLRAVDLDPLVGMRRCSSRSARSSAR